MDKFVVVGGKKLSGSIAISGAKNAVLPMMTATLLTRGVSVLENVPYLHDILSMKLLLENMNAKVEFVGSTMRIDTKNIIYKKAPYEIVRKMRASIYVFAPLLAIFKRAMVSFPGGCAIGARPVDLHLRAMEKLGADIKIEHGYIVADAERLFGDDIHFEKISVGATANALMACVLAKGTTRISNASMEPEITNLIDFLNKMGAKIEGANTNNLTIVGVKKLSPAKIKVIPDRIEAGTFLLAAAITKSKITLTNCCVNHLTALLEKLDEVGCKFETSSDRLTIIPKIKSNVSLKIVTSAYPGFPTDLQAQFIAYMSIMRNTLLMEDKIFPDRFMHVPELGRLGADISIEANIAMVRAVESLSGAQVMATDLRASAALVLAGLVANGETNVCRIYHIDRGYDAFEKKLKKLGADIRRVREE